MSYSIEHINKKVGQIKKFVLSQDMVVKDDDVRSAIIRFMNFKEIIGNMGNDIHFLALNLANSYLMKTHGVTIDLTRPAGSSGLDIELDEIAGEIKTTIPYMQNDFGAQQKHEIRMDLERLQHSSAKNKYFFIVDENTERILKAKYAQEYPSVKVINLLKV